MATIINKTKFNLSITGPGVPRETTVQSASDMAKSAFSINIAPASSETVPDAIAKDWMRRESVDAMIRAGSVIVKLDGTKPKSRPKPQPKPSETPTEEAPVAADDDDVAAFQGLHWKTAIATVSEIDDLDALEALHIAEERPRVKEAIETRMSELQGAD